MRPLLVVTAGKGSMDEYGRQLARHLPGVATLETDVGQASAESFGVPAMSRAAVRAAAADLRFVRDLRRRRDTVPHFANHHLARYGPALGRRYIVTAHDVIRWMDLRARGTPLIDALTVRDRVMVATDAAGLRRATAVVAVSQTTARHLVERVHVPRARVHVVYEGVDHELFRPVAPHREPWPYVLFVGSEHRRKEVVTLLRAFAELRREPRFRDLRLLKVGAAGRPAARYRGPVERAIRELALDGRVVFTGHVGDRQLPSLYSGATCLAFPSVAEGFGLPVLEAMACGCPVVVSTAWALPEIAGDAALAFPPRDAHRLAAALRELLSDASLCHELRAKGIARAARFTWERSAREAADVYAAVV
jgi:glycosyltransferase involved in cell wall biosynthesis